MEEFTGRGNPIRPERPRERTQRLDREGAVRTPGLLGAVVATGAGLWSAREPESAGGIRKTPPAPERAA